MIKFTYYPKPHPLLAKPFEWIMRGAFAIHLWLDGNSEWICHTFDEQRQIEKELGCNCI